MSYAYTLMGEICPVIFNDAFQSIEDVDYLCSANSDGDDCLFLFDKLLISTVNLQDVGLKGGCKTNEDTCETQNENIQVNEALEEMAQMGLPISFGSEGRRGRKTNKKKKKPLPGRAPEDSINIRHPQHSHFTSHFASVLSFSWASQAWDEELELRAHDDFVEPCLEEKESPPQEPVHLDSCSAAQLRLMLPRRAAKYWLQRFSLFSKFMDSQFYTGGGAQLLEERMAATAGDMSSTDDFPYDLPYDLSDTILLDTESWWSVTPEVLARHQANRCVALVRAGREMATRAYWDYYYSYYSSSAGGVKETEETLPQEETARPDDEPQTSEAISACGGDPSPNVGLAGDVTCTSGYAATESHGDGSSAFVGGEQLPPPPPPPPEGTVSDIIAIEGCSGCGGNVIQFASVCRHVIAIDNNLRRVKMAQHNAGVYGVQSRCDFMCTDFFAFAHRVATGAAAAMQQSHGGPSMVAPNDSCVRPSEEEAGLLTTKELTSSRSQEVSGGILEEALGGDKQSLERPNESDDHYSSVMAKTEAYPRSRLVSDSADISLSLPNSSMPNDSRHVEDCGENLGTNKRKMTCATNTTDTSDTQLLQNYKTSPTFPLADVVFFSPPWGGPKYSRYGLFDVSAPLPGLKKSLEEMLPLLAGLTGWRTESIIGIFLPRNLDLEKLNALVPEGDCWEVERNFVNGKLKGLTLYMRPSLSFGLH